jgi:D-alanyl-D-alanine carboxypeptidase
MSNLNRIKVYKYKNIAAALAVMLLSLVALSTSCGKSASDKNAKSKKSDIAESSVVVTEDKDSGKGRLTKNYKYKEMKSVGEGLLVQVDSAHPFTGTLGETEALYPYLFTKDGIMLMAAGYPSDEARADMLRQLNNLAVDFKGYCGLDTLMITSLIPDDENAAKTDEAYIGSCADLMINVDGEYKEFTGTEDYAWIPNNCYKYGFVMRGTNRLRYIGKEAAACIRDMGLADGPADFETLLTDIKEYSFEKPLYFTADNGVQYAGYFVPLSDEATTSIPIPTRSDESELNHFISGNNVDGYIVFVDLSGDTDLTKREGQDS